MVIEVKRVKVRTLCLETTGLLMALSDDLPGLLVPGRTVEELEAKLPDAIREILEAQGALVISVETDRDAAWAQGGFGPPAYIASASLQAANLNN